MQIILIAKVFGIKVDIDFTAEINVGKMAKKVFDQVLQVITKLPEQIQQKAETLLTDAKNAAQNKWNSAKDSVKNSLTEKGDDMIKAFEDLANGAKDVGDTVGNGIKDGANAAKETDIIGGVIGNRRRKGWGGRRLLENRFRARRLLWHEKLAEQKVRVCALGDKDADISLVDWEWEAENSAKLVVARIRYDEHMGIKSKPPGFLELPASYFVEGVGRLVTGKSHQKARANWEAIKPSS